MYYQRKELYNMQLYPAIDIKDGHCVRLSQGLFNEIKIYSDSPADMAKHWEDLGATYLHIVDLDGALAGESVNKDAIKKIRAAVSIPIELGGGIRDKKTVGDMLALGIDRVIIGTKAVKQPEFVKELIDSYGAEAIVVGIDAKDGFVAIEGWGEVSSIEVEELCKQMKAYGVIHIIYTDISKDGMLCGPNIKATKQLTDNTSLDIIASGGISCMEDLQNLYDSGIKGSIIGKALYENKLKLDEAVKLFE